MSLAAGDDDVAAGLVDLEDHAVDLLAQVVADVLRAADVDLAGRKEHVDAAAAGCGRVLADADKQTTLDLADDRSFDDISFFVLGDDRFPVAEAIGLPLGEQDQAEVVFDLFEKDFDLVARLGLGFVFGPFVGRDGPFTLVSDVDHDLVAIDAENDAFDNLVRVIRTRRLVVDEIHFRVGLAGQVQHVTERGVQFLFINLKFTDEVTIDHIA